MLEEDLDLYDEARGRAVPVRVYRPGAARALVLFSVGFGGGRDGYAYLGRQWAQHGLTVAVVEHIGSNLEALRALKEPGDRHQDLAARVGEQVHDEAEMRARPLDLRFAFEKLNQGAPLGLAGHSYGSYTVLAAAPELPARGLIVMSPSPPGGMLPAEAYARISLPTLVMTGTLDNGPPPGMTWQDRLRAYEALPPDRKTLAVVQGADHMAFAAQGLGVATFTGPIASITQSFWDKVFRAG